MLMDPHPSQQHTGLHHAVWQLQQEVNRPKSRFKHFLAWEVWGGWGSKSGANNSWSVASPVLTPHILKYFICEIKFTPRCSWRWCVRHSPTWCPWSSSPWTSWGWTEVRVWAGPILQNYFWSTFYLELVNSDNNHLLSTGIIEQLDSLQHDRLGISNSRNHKQIVTMLQWKRLLLLVKTTSHVTCSIQSECFIAS